MKIACICKGNDPRCLGGIETFERNLMKIFKEEIIFYVFSTDKEKIFLKNKDEEKIFLEKNIVNIQKPENFIDKILLKLLGKTRYLGYRVRKDLPDVVILNKPKDLRIFKNDKFKKILVQHGDLESYKEGAFSNKRLVKLIEKKLDKYVLLSENSKILFKNFFKFDERRVITIRHSCELPLRKKIKEKSRKLIIIARLENNQKRIDLAIKAMKKLPKYTLDIYGAGPDEEILKNLIKKEEVENRVFFRGKTTEIKEKLDEAGIFIMTSDREGYPITLIEALTRGLPIILRDTFESAEDIIEGNGILLSKDWNEDKFVEAINEIYNNYEKYSRKSLELAKRHKIDEIEKRWRNLLKNEII